MVYVPDTSGIRDKREKVTEIQEEIQIANLEKQIDLIQDEIDALNDQKDLFKDMIEESNKYYDNLIKQVEKSISELSKGADKAGTAASNAAGNVGNAISKLKDTIDTGKSLSYYIWTASDETALTNAEARIKDLNRLIESHPGDSRYVDLKNDVTQFVNEFEKLKDTRLVTDDFRNSLAELKNSEDEYLRFFKNTLSGVDERVSNVANYANVILDTVPVIIDKTGQLKQTLDDTKGSTDTVIKEADKAVESVSASVSATEEQVDHLSLSIEESVQKATESTEMLNNADVSEATASFENAVQSFSDVTEKIQEITTALNDLTNEVSTYELPPVNTENFMTSLSENGTVLTPLSDFVNRFKEICGDIPDIWNSTLSGTFGGSTGDSGSLEGTINYEELFTPLFNALDVCKSTMEIKLTECSNTWRTFQTELSQIIGADSGMGDSSNSAVQSESSGESSKGQEGADNANSIVGTIQEGGSLIDEALNGDEGWAASFGMVQESIHEYAAGIVDCVESMVTEIIDACIEAIEALNMLGDASGSGGGFTLPDPYSKKGHEDSGIGRGTEGRAHFAGSEGLPQDEKKALRSEFGQPELTIYPNGRYEVTTEPVMSDLPKGTVIYNEEQTKKILSGSHSANVNDQGKVHAKGTTNDISDTLGGFGRPIQPGDAAWELQEKLKPIVEDSIRNLRNLNSFNYTMIENQRQMEKRVKEMAVASVVNNNIQQPVNNTTFNITMPNVTNSTSAEELMRDLQSISRKKYQVNW